MLSPPSCFIDEEMQARRGQESYMNPCNEFKDELEQIPGTEMPGPRVLRLHHKNR